MMDVETFRFMTVRAAGSLVGDEQDRINLESKARVIQELQAARKTEDLSQLQKVADAFIASADFALTDDVMDWRLEEFAKAAETLAENNFKDHASAALNRIWGLPAGNLVGKDDFVALGSALNASLVAALVSSSASSRVRSRLTSLTRAYWLIGRLANDSRISKAQYQNAAIKPPPGIFPLPNPALARKPQPSGRDEKAAADRIALAAKLANRHKAVDELVSSYERHVAAHPTTEPVPIDRSTAKPAQKGFMLDKSAVTALSNETREILKAEGNPDGPVNIATAISLIERGSSKIARSLLAGSNIMRTRSLLGNAALSDRISDERSIYVGEISFTNRTPGPCAPQSPTPANTDTITIPVGHGEGKILGIADLLVLEQSLLRYELGEISHIENVMRGEIRARRFRTLQVNEEETLSETEAIQSRETELASNERFELQTESQEVISQDASKQAGLTISASYGPSVDATANYNQTSSSSRQESKAAASSFAREVSTRAVERITTRSLQRRMTRSSRTIEENNDHYFDNAGTAPDDIVGTYRYVDKIYNAQIVNYGRRLMLEFVVPEPAAFLRYAVTNRPIGDATVVEPDVPGYCIDGTSFSLLQAADIDPDNFLFWASKYGAPDVGPPPPKTRIASAVIKAPDQMQIVASRKMGSATLEIPVPDGYLPQSAYVNIFGETQKGVHAIVWQLQEQQATYVERTDDSQLYYLHLQPTSGLTLTLNSKGFHNWEVLVTVFCTLGIEKYQEWQLKTFSSIMNAYNELKSRYDQAIAEARLDAAEESLAAGNPASNKARTEIELKKGCISVLTGQRFDLFDAVTAYVAPYGYPEIDFAEAAAESRVVTMFEQSFEWSNMTYLFYPYFWGRKSEWPFLSQLQDNDANYARFLTAGAARVQVPVRPGFEASILSYLAIGAPWDAAGNIIPSGDDAEEQHLSIIEELKSQTGNNNVEGSGTLTVVNGSTEVAGIGTAFSSEDLNRRIMVGGSTYVIRAVTGPGAITLAKDYVGESDSGLGYALGGILMGQPWEIKLPTTLVKLDNTLSFS